jgi:CHAT domain-containing protein/tetratricopeptide (TPR) repeat protein
MAAGAQAADAQGDPGLGCRASGVRELEHVELDVKGMGRVSRAISVPANFAVLIAVAERGIDVRVELALDAGQMRAADSPLRRWGPQRLMVEAGPARRIDLAIIGKERVSGTASVRTYVLPAEARADDCLAALRWLASGDAHYDRGQAVTLGRTAAEPGTAHKEYFAAVADYSAAVRRLTPVTPALAAAQAELSIAATYYQGLDDWQRTIKHSIPASAEFGLVDDGYGRDRADAMAAAGEMEDLLSQPRSRNVDLEAEKRASARRAHVRTEWFRLAKSFAARGRKFDQALALNSAGLVYSNERDFEPAIETFKRALGLYDPAEKTRRAQTLQNIGLAQLELARMAEARDSFLHALGSIDEGESPRLLADTTNNLALCEFLMGRVDEALAHYSRALEILTRIQVPREQARSLNGIGKVYYSLGRRADATNYLNRALAIRTPQLDPMGRIATLRALADWERDEGRAENAVNLRQEALGLTSIAAFQTRLQIELAHDLTSSGKLVEAGELLATVFATQFPRDTVARARALRERARLSYARGDNAGSERDARDSVALFRGLGLPASSFGVLLQQAQAACALGKNAAARKLAKEALAQSEQLRDASDNPALRASSWREFRPAFDFGIRVAAMPSMCGADGPGDGTAALVVAEGSRGRALAEFRTLAAQAAVEPGADEKRRRDLFAQIAARRARLEGLADRPETNKRQVQALRSEIEGLMRQIDIIGARLGGISGEVPITRESLRQSSETLRPDTAVVEYWLGESTSYAWLITKGRIQVVELGDTARIDAAARNLYSAMRDFARVPLPDRLRNARALSDLIIAPLPAEFRRASRVYFVPDGSLHTVPFAALSTNDAGASQFLVNGRDIAVAASLAAITDDWRSLRLDGGAQVLIVADPVYSRDDARLPGAKPAPVAQATPQTGRNLSTLRGGASGDAGWTRLTASGREAAAIAKALPGAAVESLTGFAANREAVLGRNLRSFRVLHFATHAVADLESPALSTLVLSTIDEHGMTRVGEVFAGDILYRPLDADLVVFSGCETALGQSTAGEGLFGLRYAAHAAGARAVVSSLWPVIDRVGEALISEFYAAMTRDGLSPAAALSQSMRRASERWPDPAFWSVFEISRVARSSAIH